MLANAISSWPISSVQYASKSSSSVSLLNGSINCAYRTGSWVVVLCSLAFRQLCHDNFYLSPLVDDGFVDFKFSCCCSVCNFICTSDNFELILKSETMTCVFNTGHFDSKLLVATLIINDWSMYFSFTQLPFYNVLNQIKTSSIVFVNKISFSL